MMSQKIVRKCDGDDTEAKPHYWWMLFFAIVFFVAVIAILEL